MRRVRRRDTDCELALRKILFARGLRYRVDWKPPGIRSKVDVAFVGQRLAVFVDGCFWHGCPIHATAPKSNVEWWRAKLAGNQARDQRVTRALRDAGWLVMRFWSHVDPVAAASEISATLSKTTGSAGR
jgi:DNA mismatch endonuclease (patch repair protein)